MAIIDREREKEYLEQMDTILIFVGISSFRRQPELSGRIVCGFLELVPD